MVYDSHMNSYKNSYNHIYDHQQQYANTIYTHSVYEILQLGCQNPIFTYKGIDMLGVTLYA